jgi:hypothetical protein
VAGELSAFDQSQAALNHFGVGLEFGDICLDLTNIFWQPLIVCELLHLTLHGSLSPTRERREAIIRLLEPVSRARHPSQRASFK